MSLGPTDLKEFFYYLISSTFHSTIMVSAEGPLQRDRRFLFIYGISLHSFKLSSCAYITLYTFPVYSYILEEKTV